jgi:hypothetical protein
MGYYKMSFEAFNNLVENLMLFLNPSVNLVQPQVEIKKIVTTVIYSWLMELVPHTWLIGSTGSLWEHQP